MQIPFSIDEFLTVFEKYNQLLWPAQIVLNVFALVVVISIIRNRPRSNQIVFFIISFLWIWMGLIYHILFFSTINPAAYLFGGLFIVQGFIFFYVGALKQRIKIEWRFNVVQMIGLMLVVYAVILYPLVGYLVGHAFPRSPTFGVPCPTTIFTFGVLLFSVTRIPWYVVSIPFLWSIVGFFAAMNLSIKEDFGLVIAGVLSVIILLVRKPNERKVAPHSFHHTEFNT